MATEANSDVILNKNMSTLSEIDKRGLRFAPPEVRIKIFKNCFPEEEVSVITTGFPPLLKALKDDVKLYEEAIEVYSKSTTFKVDWEDGFSREATRELDEVKAIRKLVISFDYRDSDSNYEGDDIPRLQPSSLVHEILYGARNVTELTLHFPRQTYGDPTWIETDDRAFTKISWCVQSFLELEIFTLKFERSQRWLRHQLTLEIYGRRPQPGDVAFGEPFYPRIFEAVDDVLGFRGEYHHNFAELKSEEEKQSTNQTGASDQNVTVDSDEEEEQRETARMTSTWDTEKDGASTLFWRTNRLNTWLYDDVYQQGPTDHLMLGGY